MAEIEVLEPKPLRDEGGRFIKGISGNPNGRPKLLEEFTALAREYSEDALLAVVDILNDPKAKTNDKLKACEIILDRALGKPLQASQIDIGAEINENVLQVIFSSDLEKWSK